MFPTWVHGHIGLDGSLFLWWRACCCGVAIQIIEPEQKLLARYERDEKQLRETFLIKKELVVNLPAYREQMVEIQDRFGVAGTSLKSNPIIFLL